MIDPFYSYIRDNKDSVSNHMYGLESHEKNYTRLDYSVLPEVHMGEVSLEEVLHKRKTVRTFSSEKLSLEKLSYLLRFSIAKDLHSKGFAQYTFPSAGGFYPIETYLLVLNVESLEKGVYHYAASNHSIAQVSTADAKFNQLCVDFLVPLKTDTLPSFFLLMTMVKSKCFKKYGALSYLHTATEAGHRGQNICLVAAANDMACCPMGGPFFEEVSTVLGIDGANENYIYGFAIGQ